MRPSIQATWLPGGRLHLNEGPIDLIVEAFAAADQRGAAYRAAIAAFEDILPELVAELSLLRRPITPERVLPDGPVGRRMVEACAPHAGQFVTPMAAVAGAVADHVLAAMVAAAAPDRIGIDRPHDRSRESALHLEDRADSPGWRIAEGDSTQPGSGLDRAYVNDGGDIALYLAPGQSLTCGMVPDLINPRLDGRAVIRHDMAARGVATSGRALQGQGGRSLSLGIADAVTVFAKTAAAADVAATLIANEVDLPDHAAVTRLPAREIEPDSDLGSLPVTVAVGPLGRADIVAALRRGLGCAEAMRGSGLIEAAALFLHGEFMTVGATDSLLVAA